MAADGPMRAAIGFPLRFAQLRPFLCRRKAMLFLPQRPYMALGSLRSQLPNTMPMRTLTMAMTKARVMFLQK